MFQRIQNMKAKRSEESGFTLIELLVVIIILGILAAVVVFAVGGAGDKGQSAACKIDTRTIRTAEEAYAAQPTPAGGGGNYVASDGSNNETGLVTAGFLSESSRYHYVSDVVVANPSATPPIPASFKIRTQGSECGAAAGTEVTPTGPAL